MKTRTIVAGAALAAAVTAALVVVPRITVVARIAEAITSPGEFHATPDGGAVKIYTRENESMHRLMFDGPLHPAVPTELMFDHEAYRLIACNLQPCVMTRPDSTSYPVAFVYPKPWVNDRLLVGYWSASDSTTRVVTLHRSAWDRVQARADTSGTESSDD